MAKHVIVLGAGASYTSGYPLAAELRVILSSPDAFQKYIASKLNDSGLTQELLEAFKEYEKLINLFREGGFGTIDEFSFLSRDRFKEGVQILKWFISVIFALHNPELRYPKPGASTGNETMAFENSDYFPLIQRLFTDDFHELRDDVAILTYNYDPYFEFVLDRAYKTRKEAAAAKDWRYDSTNFFSGLSDRRADVLLERPGFCFLKLHGTSVVPSFSPSSWQAPTPLLLEDVFKDRQNLIKKLKKKKPMLTVRTEKSTDLEMVLAPPIFFPWEILKENGEFVTEDDFRSFEGAAAKADTRFPDGSFYSVFKAIWQRAQKEIVDAEKISFVGLSMHPFLKSGLKFLFQERNKLRTAANPNYAESALEIVLACPEAMHPGADFGRKPAHNSAAAKLISILTEVNRLIMTYSSGCLQTPIVGKSGSGGIICYEDFASFIKAEL